MKKFFKNAALVLSALMISSCLISGCSDTKTADENKNGDTGFVFTKENYPKMGGSLANLPLGEAVTASVLGISRDEADGLISFTGSTTDNYKAIVDGDFDILLAYEPSEEAKNIYPTAEKSLK